MQAPLSYTASGEQFFRALPSALVPPLAHASNRSRQRLPGTAPAEERARSVFAEERVAEGIGLAHDAGNLLGAIRLYCDLLALPGVLRAEHRHYAEELRQLSARSGTLIDRLLTGRVAATPQGHGHSQGERAECPFETVQLAEVVAACRGLLQTIAGEEALLVSIEAGVEAGARTAVPREALERILVNLLKNAVEARVEGASGTIVVRVRSVVEWAQHGGIALSVEDRGQGMSEAAVRRLLSGQAAHAPMGSKSKPGRGIGFQVVRELVAATGGELRIRSRPGQGTTVEVVWARVPPDAPKSG